MADARGPVNTGPGDQYNNITQLFHDSRGRTPRAVDLEEVTRLRRRFVYPPGFAAAREILHGRRTVILDGPPGSGRNAAARVLLREIGGPGRHLHELLPDDPRNGADRLDREAVGDSDLLLLDLSDGDEQLWRDVRPELSALRETVRQRGAHLVIVLPHHRSGPVTGEPREYLAEIRPPLAGRVLQSHLRSAEVPAEETVASAPAVNAFLSRSRPMAEVAAFASLVVRARSAAPGAGYPQWCEKARAAMDQWLRDVADKVETLRRGPQRALLLATAMLHGAPADTVHQATLNLLSTTGYPRDDQHLLERADLAERLKEVGAETAGDGRVIFGKVNYEAAVRRHFWDHIPELREHLRDWTGTTVERVALTEDDQDRLVRRFSAECLRTGHTSLLRDLVFQCSSSTVHTGRLRAAAQALEQGLNNQRHARYFRQEILEWARRSLPAGLARVLVGVCAEVMAVRHPDQAVVRLHHLARRERHVAEAREALLRLLGRDRSLVRLMLKRLAGPLMRNDWPADAMLFLRLTDPAAPGARESRLDALFAEPGVRKAVVSGWGAVFRHLPQHRWEEHVRRWYTAASTDAERAGPLLTLLVDGAGGNGETLARLYGVARRWAREPVAGPPATARDSLAGGLLRKINDAQGLRAA
ncbi:hypothetical protein [Streptomyces zingiberis]|uniref:ATP-binding protein n=1 Tax=Streptomyces zingiberis TaxID=2053010 RepID=A0ABX1BX43_9ACTN|nr:hypothetical protein [Streptomyces zingiberis]NJQ00858.1 hypothetical protein [Streptomyces zingiberis]